MLGVITIAVVVTLGLLSTAIQNLLNNVIASLEASIECQTTAVSRPGGRPEVRGVRKAR